MCQTNTHRPPLIQRIIDLLQEAALRISSMAAQLAQWAYDLDQWMRAEQGESPLLELLDAILAALQPHVKHSLISAIITEIRNLLRGPGSAYAYA